MKIYALRHGKTAMNIQGLVNGEIDEPLAPEGIEQAKDVSKRLPPSVAHIHVSPLKRAVQTAEIITQLTDIPHSIESALSEVRMGKLAGKSWNDMPDGEHLKQLHRSVTYDYQPYGGESVRDVLARLQVFFLAVDQHYKDYELLIITHGGILRTLCWLESGEAPYETEKNLELVELDVQRILTSLDSRL